MRRTELQRGPGPKRTGFTGASILQREKVRVEGCRETGEHGSHVHPAHVTPRSLGGCDHPDCVVGLRADYHRLYDNGEFDLLPYLTLAEQAHAVSHLGLIGALKRTTNERWAPVGETG